MGTLLALLSFTRLDAEEKGLDGGSFLFPGLSERVVFWDILAFGRSKTNTSCFVLLWLGEWKALSRSLS